MVGDLRKKIEDQNGIFFDEQVALSQYSLSRDISNSNDMQSLLYTVHYDLVQLYQLFTINKQPMGCDAQLPVRKLGV